MKIISMNIGKPTTVVYNGKEVKTGFYKIPVQESLYLAKLNFEGDEQADLINHGGVDKAVCVYPHEHYSFWEKELAQDLQPAAFGENLTVAGMLETDVHIGDVFKIGDAILQLSQPRQPCYKIAGRHNVKDLMLRLQKTGFTGYYFRVLEEGNISPDSSIERLSIHPAKVTVANANEIMYEDINNKDAIQKHLAIEELSGSWRERFEKRLEKLKAY
ncbi:MOSC domain-containing protein [Sporosarcina sp. JAI121]|uniref:MOSC domain-containing protein n=1 Tax=Sporosarcina sp. JAI121 TaxID=2723064 RepID=UPI0015C7EE48|nr:MOSC domain-containing protein [Sporosarcina sp. JAI121]NYF24440.1 MOSC domain-containing protein YiiM [Sporosarcina sp. JAI121]